MNDEKTDHQVRLFIFRTFVESGVPPSIEQTAKTLTLSKEEASSSYKRLNEKHIIVLDKKTGQIRMAMPFSSVPTAFQVKSGERIWWANCAWDALGIPAALHEDAEIRTKCPDCEEALNIGIREGRLNGNGVIHYAIPAKRWWEDIVFT